VEHRLLVETEGVVAAPVELLRRQAAEVADPGQRERQNWAMDLRALVTAGFCPVIVARSRMAPSISLLSRAASPTPMLTVTLTTPGTCIGLPNPNSWVSAGLISSR
jgi:hypothetical protein